MKKILLTLIFILIFSQTTFAHENSEFSYRQMFIENDLIEADADFDRELTKAEFVTLINRIFDLKDKAQVSYFDVQKNNWFYYEVSKAISAGYLETNENKYFKPDELITEEAAAKMILKLKGFSSSTEILNTLNNLEIYNGKTKFTNTLTLENAINLIAKAKQIEIINYNGNFSVEKSNFLPIKYFYIFSDDVTFDNIDNIDLIHIYPQNDYNEYNFNNVKTPLVFVDGNNYVNIKIDNKSEIDELYTKTNTQIVTKELCIKNIFIDDEEVKLIGMFDNVFVNPKDAKLNLTKNTFINNLILRHQIEIIGAGEIKDIKVTVPNNSQI